MMRKRRFAYGAWLLFVILLYFFENNTGTRTILAASVFLPAVSVLCAVRSARRVTVHLSAPDCCKQEDAAECSVQAMTSARSGADSSAPRPQPPDRIGDGGETLCLTVRP